MLAGGCDLHVVFKGKLCFLLQNKKKKQKKIVEKFTFISYILFHFREFLTQTLFAIRNENEILYDELGQPSRRYTHLLKYRLFQSYC